MWQEAAQIATECVEAMRLEKDLQEVLEQE